MTTNEMRFWYLIARMICLAMWHWARVDEFPAAARKVERFIEDKDSQ